MTKKELKQQMVALIEEYYIECEGLEDVSKQRDFRCKIAGIERLAINLKINLWNEKYKYPIFRA